MQQYSKQNVLFDNLSYEEAYSLMNRSKLILVITRPDWEGYHFEDRYEGDTGLGYIILTKEDNLIVNPKEIYNKESKDWQVVLLTNWQVAHLARKISEVEEANA